MKLIYIAGPFTDTKWWRVLQNIRRAENMALKVAEMGAMPVCPHTMTGNFWGLQTEQFWYEGTLKLLSVCDAVIFIGNWQCSQGSCSEYDKAFELGIPKFKEYDIGELQQFIERHNLSDTENPLNNL